MSLNSLPMSNRHHHFKPDTAAATKLLALVLVLSVFFNLAFAVGAGGFSSDLGGDPDEAAHAVTALMLRDYLGSHLGQHPMAFAKAYYADFPRVALGHYPPLYYVLTAPLLLLYNSVGTLLIFQALTLALLATLTHLMGCRFLKPASAAASSLGILLLPLALKLNLHVMSDILLAMLCIWAVMLWAWYLQAPTVRRALIWGCVAAAAILTKGSGMGLCLLPPLGTLLAGRWRLILTWSWWCAALPVAILAGPWMIYSTGISKEGMTLFSPAQYFVQAVPFYLKGMPAVFGWPLTLLTVAGVSHSLVTSWRQRAFTPIQASLFAMTAGMTLVLLLVPVGLSTRYMLTLAPPVMLAAAYGMALIPWPVKLERWCPPVLLLGYALLPLLNADVWPTKYVHGFNAAVSRSGLPKQGDAKQNWLVASDPNGEGAVIAAAAFACPQRSPSLLRIYRGSKELSSSDWMGRGYKPAFVNNGQLLEHLDKLQITRVFVDLSVPQGLQQPHERLLFTTMKSAADRWHLAFEQSIYRRPWETGMLYVFQRNPPATANAQN
jgi:hypothetical protein